MTTTIKRIGTVAAGAARVLVLIWYLALFSPQRKKLADAHKARASAEQKASQLQGQIAQLQVLESQVPADTKRLQQLTAAVPDNPQLASALDQLQAAASRSGVSLGSVGPSTPPATASPSSSSSQSQGAPSIAVSMTASGSYGQLMAFIRAIDAMPRTLVVNSLDVSAGNSKVSAQISANIFYAGQPTP